MSTPQSLIVWLLVKPPTSADDMLEGLKVEASQFNQRIKGTTETQLDLVVDVFQCDATNALLQTIETQLLAAESCDRPSAPNLSRRHPDILLFVEPTFATWTWDDYQYLQSTFPLARLVTLTGAWAAGGARSGKQWPGSLHLPQQQLFNQFSIFIRQFSAGLPTLWDGPTTASSAERLANANTDINLPLAVDSSLRNDKSEFQIGLVGSDRSMLQALSKACDSLGFHNWKTFDAIEEVSQMQTPSLVIWDWVAAEKEANRLDAALEAECPVIVLLSYAEIQMEATRLDLKQAEASNRIHVLRKPFLMDELQATISNLSFQNR